MPNEVAAILSAYEPSWRERIGNATYDIARYLGAPNANRMRNDIEGAVDFIPAAGDALAVNDVSRDLQAGNYMGALGGAGLAAIGAVPAVGDVASKGIRVWTGGVGDPLKAALGKGAWLSEAPDLAQEYAGSSGKVMSGYIQPKNPIQFRHAEQSRTVGDIISTALEGAPGDVNPEDILPVIDSLRARYGESSMPLFEYWNNDPEIASFFRSLGYDSISAAEKSNMSSQTWAALTPEIISFD